MSSMPDGTTQGDAGPDAAVSEVTLIAGRPVRAGSEKDFAGWAEGLVADAANASGCREARSIPPSEEGGEWTGLFRFDTIANLRAWMDSPRRQTMLEDVSAMAAGPASQRVITAPGAEHPAPLATLVIDYPVEAALTDDFLAWYDRVLQAQRDDDEFRGSELFRPVPGVQLEWTAVFRYGSATAMEAWLQSSAWADLRADGRRFGTPVVRRIDSSFGSWFEGSDSDQSDDASEARPSRTRTAASIVLGLYPTVLVLSVVLGVVLPADLALWERLLLTNVSAVVVMTFLTMPYVVNPQLGKWTRCDRREERALYLRGWALIVGVVACVATLGWLVTTVIWTLP